MNAKDLVFAIFRQLKDEQKRELLPYPTVAGLTHLMAAVEEKIKKSTEPIQDERLSRLNFSHLRNIIVTLRAEGKFEPMYKRNSFFYFIMNKPVGVTCERINPGNEEKKKAIAQLKNRLYKQPLCIYDVLPRGYPSVCHVGRLDKDTCGLLFFTDDTRLIKPLLDKEEAESQNRPGAKKVYYVDVSPGKGMRFYHKGQINIDETLKSLRSPFDYLIDNIDIKDISKNMSNGPSNNNSDNNDNNNNNDKNNIENNNENNNNNNLNNNNNNNNNNNIENSDNKRHHELYDDVPNMSFKSKIAKTNIYEGHEHRAKKDRSNVEDVHNANGNNVIKNDLVLFETKNVNGPRNSDNNHRSDNGNRSKNSTSLRSSCGKSVNFTTTGAIVDVISPDEGNDSLDLPFDIYPLAKGAHCRLRFELSEGKNRQIRRICARAGLIVNQLLRYRFASITMDNLPVGAVRSLTGEEVVQLYKDNLDLSTIRRYDCSIEIEVEDATTNDDSVKPIENSEELQREFVFPTPLEI